MRILFLTLIVVSIAWAQGGDALLPSGPAPNYLAWVNALGPSGTLLVAVGLLLRLKLPAVPVKLDGPVTIKLEGPVEVACDGCHEDWDSPSRILRMPENRREALKRVLARDL